MDPGSALVRQGRTGVHDTLDLNVQHLRRVW